jgi:hypothetical protein
VGFCLTHREKRRFYEFEPWLIGFNLITADISDSEYGCMGSHALSGDGDRAVKKLEKLWPISVWGWTNWKSGPPSDPYSVDIY